jgi:predicted DNA-binding protein
MRMLYLLRLMHRTTVEITEEQRRRLIALATERGERGFSRIVQEALERYLADVSSQVEARQLARYSNHRLPEATPPS